MHITHTHTRTHARTYTHPFNCPFSGTTQVSRYQKGTCKTNLDFTEARDSEWQWHQLGHMQVCTSLQTDDHASTPPLTFLQAGCPSCRPTNSVKALKALICIKWNQSINQPIYVNCVLKVDTDGRELSSWPQRRPVRLDRWWPEGANYCAELGSRARHRPSRVFDSPLCSTSQLTPRTSSRLDILP